MNKVICDICGTSYPETAECCPICGCSRDVSVELAQEEEDFLQDSPITSARKLDGRFVSGGGIQEEPDEDWDDDEYDEDEEDDDEEAHHRGKTGVVILLTVVIMLLLSIVGFLFLRYLLPNLGSGEPEETQAEVQTEAPVETTTEPGIPCEQLILMSGAAVDLTREGEYRLINVIVKPEDSTDKLEYYSEDETVATVNSEGRVTAISEGETVINILCGNQKLQCRVFVYYVEETEPPTEETTLATEAEEEPDASEETQPEAAAETEPEETEPPTEETKAAGLKDVVLKLGRTDVSLGVGYQFTIPLDCDLSYEEIEWSTGNENIATVKNGVITTHASGTTLLTAKYGDQTVTCWIRVKF